MEKLLLKLKGGEGNFKIRGKEVVLEVLLIF